MHQQPLNDWHLFNLDDVVVFGSTVDNLPRYPDIFPNPIFRMAILAILPNDILPPKKFTESNFPNNYFSE